MSGMSHLDDQGRARMVDVSGKPETVREAVAEALVTLAPATRQAVFAGDLPKGDARAVVRLAAIMGAKRTADLVPLCHPIELSAVEADIEEIGERGPGGGAGAHHRAHRGRDGGHDRGRPGGHRPLRHGQGPGPGRRDRPGPPAATSRGAAPGSGADEGRGAHRQRPGEPRRGRGSLRPPGRGPAGGWGFAAEVRVVPDGVAEVEAGLRSFLADGVALVVTTGGTGFSPRDLTPEATRRVLEREAPGLAEAMRAATFGANPHGMLSRGVAGIAGSDPRGEPARVGGRGRGVPGGHRPGPAPRLRTGGRGPVGPRADPP